MHASVSDGFASKGELMRFIANMGAALLIFGCSEVSQDTAPVTFGVGWYPTAGGDLAQLGGVEICQTGTMNCATTDENGAATLQLPVGGAEFSYTVEKEEYANYLIGDINPRGFHQEIVMVEDQEMAQQHARVGSPYPMRGTGTVLLEVLPARPDVMFELMEATGKRFYVDEEGDWNPDLAATSSSGWGGFTEVSPGEFQIKAGGVDEFCSFRIGWRGDVEGGVRFPVRDGYTTIAAVVCVLAP